MQVTIGEAAHHLGISEHTIRRRVRSGELPGIQVATPQGFKWRVEVPEAEVQEQAPIVDGKELALAAMEARIQSLERQLEAREREVGQLHHLLAQQALQPASRSWWRFWR